MNERSGGIFWSQEYTHFGQIQIPVNSIEVGAIQQIEAFYENPTVRLEFERFASDSQIEYQNIQTQMLKKYTTKFVTTNATGLATNSIDYYKSTKASDMYAFDYYPGFRNTSVKIRFRMHLQGESNRENTLVSWSLCPEEDIASAVPEGSSQIRERSKQAVFQSVAHGADLMLHFQYRTFPFGAEQLNYAIVDMDGIPRRRYYEMQETAALLKKIEPYEEARICQRSSNFSGL